MSRTRSVAVAAVLLCGLAACGGPAPTQKAAETGPEGATIKAGALVPEALVDARCAPDAAGAWSASGALTNRTARTMSYDVIVQLGAANGQPSTAYVKRVSDVRAGKTADFTVAITGAVTGDATDDATGGATGGATDPTVDRAPAGPCRIQVRTAPDDDSD